MGAEFARRIGPGGGSAKAREEAGPDPVCTVAQYDAALQRQGRAVSQSGAR